MSLEIKFKNKNTGEIIIIDALNMSHEEYHKKMDECMSNKDLVLVFD